MTADPSGHVWEAFGGRATLADYCPTQGARCTRCGAVVILGRGTSVGNPPMYLEGVTTRDAARRLPDGSTWLALSPEEPRCKVVGLAAILELREPRRDKPGVC